MLPLMRTKINLDQTHINKFGGINLTEKRGGGEVIESENMTATNYPALSSRYNRNLCTETNRIINGICDYNGFAFTSYSEDMKSIFLTFDGTDYEYTSLTDSDDFKLQRKFATLADTILIIPDNLVFSVKSRIFTKICVSEKYNSSSAHTKYKTETNGKTDLNQDTIDHIASYTHNSITSRSTTYSSSGTKTFYYMSFPSNLKQGDVITIKMNVYSNSSVDETEFRNYSTKMNAGITVKIKSVTSTTHATASGSVTEITGLTFEDNTIDTGGYYALRIRTISIERGMPSLTDLCSFGNRVWGVSGKEIFTSKLADASEWNDFSTDSEGTLPYACFSASAQTEGDFTAILPYGNYVYAFKQNYLHKVYGDTPDEYSIHTQNMTGVEKGMENCIVTCRDCMIYASYDGIYVYRGSYPTKISENIGTFGTPIAASANENTYYLLCELDGKKVIYTYNLETRIWHKESAPDNSLLLCSCKDKTYAVEGGKIFLLNPDDNTDNDFEKSVRWRFAMRTDDKHPEKRICGRLSLRYSLGKNSSFTVRAKYDDGRKGAVCGVQHDEADSSGCALYMPIKRCLWFELEFCGIGEFTLKSINLKQYRGSEK